MGYASCLENNIEKADDCAFMARMFRFPAALVAVSHPRMTPQFARPKPASAPASIDDRWREMREIHVLCLSELRPKWRAGLHVG